MTAEDRNAVVVQTLTDIARETCRFRQYLGHDLHFGSFQRQTARHDHTHIAGAQDHDPVTRHNIADIDKILDDSSGKNSCGTRTGDGYSAARPLAAAERQYDSSCPECLEPGSTDGCDLDPLTCCHSLHAHDLMSGHDLGAGFCRLALCPDRVLGTCQLFLIPDQAKAVVNTLI